MLDVAGKIITPASASTLFSISKMKMADCSYSNNHASSRITSFGSWRNLPRSDATQTKEKELRKVRAARTKGKWAVFHSCKAIIQE
eukprot:c10881_g1_i1 orf=277-534(-)